jgi:hypothetical protein
MRSTMISSGLISSIRRGSALIGILIVVVIVMGILLAGPLSSSSDSKGRSIPQVIRDIDRGKDVACGSNRDALRSELTMLQIDNPRVTAADPAVVQLMNKTRCPGGGIYVFDRDGSIRCTAHDPPSLATLMALVQTPRPTAEELASTPDPSPLIAAEKPAG